MLSLKIGADGRWPLVEQIVVGIRREIDERHLRPGTRLPSIRAFAERYRVSRFTVVEAYDRLVAMGYLHSRRGAGFYAQSPQPLGQGWAPNSNDTENPELLWLIRRSLLEVDENALFPGAGWLPNDWLDSGGLRQSMNVMVRRRGAHLHHYGKPYGYTPLREHLSVLLGDVGISVGASQILLTTGASQALDFVIRLLLRMGDMALVDEPGYYNLFGMLRLHGVNVVGVPRNRDGPDIDTLERLVALHQPKVYFAQTVLHNPTGTTMAPNIAFRVLQMAERCDFTIVEDDVFSDLQSDPTPRLATLDQLKRVVYIRSFSKTLSGSLRVGFIASQPNLIEGLADIKMLTSITSSELTERLIYQTLVDGHYRKYLARLRARLDNARAKTIRTFERVGVELFAEPADGMYLWARFPLIQDSLALAERVARKGLMLAPGAMFHPRLDPSPWIRFNVALCDNPQVERWFERISAEPELEAE